MIEKKYKKELLYFTIKDFGDEKVNHLFSTKVGWNQENIFKGVEEVFEIGNDKIYRGTQVHGDNIVIVDEKSNENYKNMEFDGLITNRKDVALLTYHADCTPLYFYDPNKEVIGMAHSGWRGTLLNIGGKMIDKMVSEFGCDIEDIEVGIGPAIGVECYEVKEDVSSQFEKIYGEHKIIINNKGIIYLDIPFINRINILNSGVKEDNLFQSDFCTSCNTDQLFSYRRENTKGRMVAGIILNER